MSRLLTRWQQAHPALRVFLFGILFFGINEGIMSAIFNNFLLERFALTADTRSALEFPRELPGFLIIFTASLLAFVRLNRWAMTVAILYAIGNLGLAYFSPDLALAVGWIFIWSTASHLMMPLEGTIGLLLANQGKQGRRLGQISGARNFALLGGMLLVWWITSENPHAFSLLFTIAAAASLIACLILTRLNLPGEEHRPKRRFVFRKKYHLYYLLSVLFGARKQIFLTFAPWVLVSVFQTPPKTIAIVLFIAACLSTIFRNVFGYITDRYGERAVLIGDAILLAAICLGYALSKNVLVLYTLFIADNLMFAVRIAHTTFLNRIVVEKSDITPTLSLGITIDHAVAMTIPFVGGFLWTRFGYPSVFYTASAISLLNFCAALAIGRRPVATSITA